MSLTSFIQEHDVRSKFKETFPLPKIELNSDMKAPPVTTHYPLVGTAFDYLLRFYIKKMNSSAKTSTWVAEASLDLVKGHKIHSRVQKIINDSKILYKNYLKTGKLNDGLLMASLMLAKTDAIYRAGYIDPEIDVVDEGDVKDLRNLIGIVNKSHFTGKTCLLNPTFGKGSELVGGADADIVLDNQIIDIKTTKFLTLKEKDFHQLIGYYILSLIGEIDGTKKPVKIDQISIYFSRHGVLLPLSVPSKDSAHAKISKSDFNRFIDWFEKRARESNDSLSFGS